MSTRVGSGRALLGPDHRGKVWKPSQGFHVEENCPPLLVPGYWVTRNAMSRRSRTTQTWILRCLAALLLAATFGYGPYYLYAQSGFARYLQLRRDLAVTQAKNARLRIEVDRLSREAEALRSDRRAVERVARADLGWVRPGEVIFDMVKGP